MVPVPGALPGSVPPSLRSQVKFKGRQRDCESVTRRTANRHSGRGRDLPAAAGRHCPTVLTRTASGTGKPPPLLFIFNVSARRMLLIMVLITIQCSYTSNYVHL